MYPYACVCVFTYTRKAGKEEGLPNRKGGATEKQVQIQFLCRDHMCLLSRSRRGSRGSLHCNDLSR